MTRDPITLASRLAAGDPPTPEVVDWLATGLRRFLRGENLEIALGLNGASRIRARNAALIEAAHILRNGRDLSAWDAAGLLAGAIARFESVIIPRLKSRAITPADLNGQNAALLRAYESGARPLKSRRRLYDVLND